ncbi:MAG TPA: ABC transporter permease subunit [Anaerolineae bacterium]|nr:ABC transporter permease subunit [Anaerolineae bacterium]HPL29742.1 ABC transporter permease subunit [Anaerolineae bacterium]
MIADVWTIMWKEWKELLLAQGSGRGGLVRLGLMIGVFGVFMPLQTGREWVTSPMSLVFWAWVPLFLVVGVVADAFAGERERHTLETLLASRMPNRSILFGKVLAAISYGWGLTLASLLLGLIAVNVVHGHGELLLYPPLTVVAGTVLGFLTAGLAASVGVLVSLRAATVRQAAQTMSFAVIAIVCVPVAIVGALPRLFPDISGLQVQAWLINVNWSLILVAAAAVLAVVDAVVLAAAMARFQRAKLILD